MAQVLSRDEAAEQLRSSRTDGIINAMFIIYFKLGVAQANT